MDLRYEIGSFRLIALWAIRLPPRLGSYILGNGGEVETLHAGEARRHFVVISQDKIIMATDTPGGNRARRFR